MKIERVSHEGRWYNTIFRDDGRSLTQDELFTLSIRTVDPNTRRVRRLLCVPLTSEPPRHGDFAPDIENGNFIVLPRAGLILGGTGLEIGEAEAFSRMEAGATEGVDFPHLAATFYLHNSKLSEIVWDAIQDQLLDGVCAVVTFIKPTPPETRSVDGIITECRLGMLSDSCFPSSRIIFAWEESIQ